MGTIKSKMQKDIFKICRGRNCIKIIDGNDRNIYCSYRRITQEEKMIYLDRFYID